MRKAAFTIASKKYLSRALVALESFSSHNPGWDAWLLLSDEAEGFFDPSELGFPMISVDELGLPEPQKYKFRYSEGEFSASLKPWGALHLMEQKGYERILYLDGDTCSYGPFDALERALDTGVQIVLSPHLLWGSPPGAHLVEGDILKGGSYNLGFLALNRGPDSLAMLRWLAEILVLHCHRETWSSSKDQKWMDLVPALFESYTVLRRPGYNVASWNLQERELTLEAGEYRCRSEKLAFFHFSEYDLSRPTRIKKHKGGVDYEDLGEAKRILTDYALALTSSPWAACVGWTYAYARFGNASEILPEMRRRYREDADLQAHAGEDPFSKPEFFASLNFFRASLLKLAYLTPKSLRFALLPPPLRKALRRVLRGRIEQ